MNPSQSSDSFFYAICEHAPVMMHIFNQEGIILSANTRCVDELGYTAEALVGGSLAAIMTVESAAHMLDDYLLTLWHEGRISERPLQYRCRDGKIIDVLMSASLVTAEAGRRVAVGVLQNVTDQKRIERAEREQRLLAQALRDTTAALNSTLDFDEVLDRILANVAQVLPYDTGNIMLIEGGRARMVRNQRATEPGREIKVPTAAFEIAQTPTLRSMYENSLPLAIPDTHDYPDWVELPQSAWIRSFVGAPIIEEGHVIGYV
ncbi:MAG: PAS domain S-box protein, partial [Anaerolineae bacterium]|nr:PAS domain S-box protein [Anaerolineae bacterium]